MQRTFSIIKPDAVRRNLEGEILQILQKSNFKILALKKMQFRKELAEQFYYEHKKKPFFRFLCDFMTSSPIVCSILEKENAISDYRTLMGATNPKEATIGTLRYTYGLSLDENSVHGSDSLDSAQREMNLIFHSSEIF